MSDVAAFYDDLAHYYHLLFEDWDASIARQQADLGRLLAAELGSGPKRILDAACGIGTQALGFAAAGHRVRGSDLSPAAIARARREASARGLEIAFGVADLRQLSGYHAGPFDVVAALDNALPHLESADELGLAAREMAALLAPGGLFMASVRDYESLERERPRATRPKVFGGGDARRVVFQVWDWLRDGSGYRIHQYILEHRPGGEVSAKVFTTRYHAWRRAELLALLADAGLEDVRWLPSEESGFYQPLLLARKAGVS